MKFDVEHLAPRPLAQRVRDPVKELERIESLHGVSLPSEYRTFLMETGAPITFDTTVVYRPKEKSPWDDEDGTQSVEVLYGLGKGDYSLSTLWKRYADQIDEQALPIAGAPGGNQICLIVDGAKRSRVYFWDHEGDVDPEEELANMYLIAKSFGAFMALLEVEEKKEVNLEGVVAKLDF